jgi:hypothetical protein
MPYLESADPEDGFDMSRSLRVSVSPLAEDLCELV